MKNVFPFLAYSRRTWWAFVLSVLSVAAVAQTAIGMQDLPYFCDFEDDAENANWVLNPGLDLIVTDNAWYIGTADAYTGDKGLYISATGGGNTTYAKTNNVLIAYRDISLDMGNYDVAFDWTGMGNGDDGYLKVVFEGRSTQSITCLGNAAEPSWVSYATSLMGDNTSLNGADGWQHVQAIVRIPRALANATDTRIFFVWVNNTAEFPKDQKDTSSVVIDNFQLAKASPTGYPEDIHVTTYLNTSTVSWTGGADSYEVLYRRKGEEEFVSVTTDEPAVTLTNVAYGAYEFWICGVNGTDKTVYTIFPIVYLYETDCFDVLNMYGAGFEYGTWSADNAGNVNKKVQGYTRMDYGYDDVRSRHTTHFDKEEIDPRTVTYMPGNKTYALHTVPDDEFGSVRLGNWGTGSQYEQIQFRYMVESDLQALLLLKYAIVLENPDHSAKDQPRFTVTITDASGQSVDAKCGDVDFHAPTPAEWEDPEVKALWHESNVAGKVHWQDWRTIGINLAEHVGKELTITFTSYDCDQSGHFGYAYFTLRCSRADVDGIPWGGDAKTQTFTAPAGFDYAWFNKLDTALQDTISTERYFDVAEEDENDYICYVTYPTSPECGFVFEASAKPHSPVAEIQYEWVPQDCKNGVFVKNASHIGLLRRSTGIVEHRYDMQIENCRWTMPDGSTTDSLLYEGFYVPMPDEGGTLTYSIWAGVYVNDSVFQDSATVTIQVPPVGPLEVDIYEKLCSGEEIEFPAGSGVKYRSKGDYKEEKISLVTGCDSITWLHLDIIQPLMADVYDTICSEGEYWFVDEFVTEPRIHKKVLRAESTGCDSIVSLHLAKAERPSVVLQNAELCGEEALVFDVAYSEWADSVKIIVQGQGEYVYAARQPDMQMRIDPGTIRANAARYSAQVLTYMPWCETYVDTCSFNINLSSYVVEVVLDNVFAICNTENNGGYEMVSFQWYADGEPIAGENAPVFYAEHMPQETIYTVQVTLADGTPLWICPFTLDSRTPIESTQQDKTPRCRKFLRGGNIYIELNGKTYTLTGTEVTMFQ